MSTVTDIQKALRKFIRDNTFPYVIKKAKIESVDKEAKECVVKLPKGTFVKQVKFKDTVPVAGDDVYIVCYDSEGQEYHILDQSIDKKESFYSKYDEDYKIKATKLDLTADKIYLNAEYVKLGKLRDVLLELIDLNIEMLKTQTLTAPALLDKVTLLPKFEKVKTNLSNQLLE